MNIGGGCGLIARSICLPQVNHSSALSSVVRIAFRWDPGDSILPSRCHAGGRQRLLFRRHRSEGRRRKA